LIGGKAAGKTTLLAILSTLIAPDAGTARVHGHNITEEPVKVRESIGIVFHEGGVYDRFTVRENLKFCAALRRMDDRSIADRTEELLNSFNFIKEADAPCSTLTDSQRRRLAIACASIHQPAVLMIDQSIEEMDIITTRLISQFITSYPETEKTVIIATRNLVEARLLCSKMALLRSGFLVAAGTLQDLERSAGEAGLREALPELELERS
jgi:ABC-2 type transport system ATP-binding protein